MELVSQFAVGGGVYALAFLEEEGKLVATVNSRVSLAKAHRSVRRACLRLTIFFPSFRFRDRSSSWTSHRIISCRRVQFGDRRTCLPLLLLSEETSCWLGMR